MPLTDSDVGEIDELERLLSQCRELNTDESGIASFVRDTLRVNPIYVKSKGLPSSIATKNKFENQQLIPVSPVSRATRLDGLSTSKRHLSVINRQGDPLFLPNHDGDKQSDDLEELGSSHKDFCDDKTKNLPHNKNVLVEYLKPDF
ncbi:hypothetical protein KSP40_PGU016000 [Platanthera guangdongensis]|uniref:Uncharacterized protein n=1 Tax=Platanthera guangdongensis TaxID=2320717 RepID=A0ABR2MXJ6_9ASPA